MRLGRNESRALNNVDWKEVVILTLLVGNNQKYTEEMVNNYCSLGMVNLQDVIAFSFIDEGKQSML